MLALYFTSLYRARSIFLNLRIVKLVHYLLARVAWELTITDCCIYKNNFLVFTQFNSLHIPTQVGTINFRYLHLYEIPFQ